jgi:putative oxidoreductase
MIMGGKLLLLGRVVFSYFFLYSGFNHLTKLAMYAQYAGASGVPAPTLLTAISGLMLLAGGLSILLGVQPRVGALLVAVFLVAAAFWVHKFWELTDPMMAANQKAQFWKNITLTGACLMIIAFATMDPARWPYSIGRGGRGAAAGTSEATPPGRGR